MTVNNSDKLDDVMCLVGAGGHGRETMEQIKSLASQGSFHIPLSNIFFAETEITQSVVNNCKVLKIDEFVALPSPNKFFNISISDHVVRKRIAEYFMNAGCQSIQLRSKLSSIGEHNSIEEGSIISEFATITTNTKIGKFLHLNRHASISHDCIIGNFVTFAPYANASGNVHIHDGAYIGAGATIKQGSLSKPLIIGKNAIIGMGAVVTKDVPEHCTVIGNPARIINE